MQTEKEIKARLKEAKKSLRETHKRFEKYDNHDDMDLIPVIRGEVETLEWVLSNV